MSMHLATALDDRFPRLFWRLDDAAHEAFGRYGKTRDVPAGHVILREGDPSISFFLVLDGEVSVSIGATEITRVGKNHSLGEMGMLLDVPRSGTATAAVPSRLLEISRADIQAMLEAEPVWAARLYRVIAECLAEYLRAASAERSARGAAGGSRKSKA
jgi:CRP-like cAMP-binding protein